jgi:ADP-ribose pyrophosphatase
VPVLDFLSSPGISDEFATLFVAAADSAGLPSNAGAAHEREMTRPFAVAIDAALAALAANTVRSGYTLLALQWLALNRARLGELIG